MAYFNENMTSSKARCLFFDLADKMKKDEISMEEFGKVIAEYKEVSEKIIRKELEQCFADALDGRYILTEDTIE